MGKILVLGSGGMKTLLLAAAAQKEGTPVICYLDFGSPNRSREILCNKQIAAFTDANLHILEAPKELQLTSSPASMVMCFCWLLEHALHLECSILYHGLSKEDYVKPSASLAGPDCHTILANEKTREQFYSTITTLFTLLQPLYTKQRRFIGPSAIELPLYKLTRKQIVELGDYWHLPWDLTWSCLHGDIFHCGKCTKCIRRKNAFLYASISDPTIYRQKGK